jgi:ATP-dependent helicase HrpB
MTENRTAFPPLPIDNVLPELKAALTLASSAVLVAEPGAGKTTRVPLALLDAPWCKTGKILLLAPRRVAARAAAHQMSRLLGENAGETVGYRVRLESKVSGKTRVEIMTEGVFTRMIIDDPELRGVDAVIFDEFHERNLDADLGLALALDVQAGLRPGLRLLVMSATIDAARVSALMGEARVIAAKGRSFPVQMKYAPPAPHEKIEDTVTKAALQALRTEMGSLLLFLPGMREIERVAENLRVKVDQNTIIAPLYGTLDLAEQDRAIQPPPQGKRKIVIASAIAETSLTIEGVRVVIDGGYSRVPRYNPGSGLTRLETVRVSQASAEQRRGRAGRLEPGICYRLWAEGQTRALPPFNRPEILEADLSAFTLACAAFGVINLENLRFLDAPPAAAQAEARALLRQLEALDEDGKITEVGRQLAKVPLNPRLAHMLLRSAKQGAGHEAAKIAALLSERGLGGNAADLTERLRSLTSEKSPRAKQALAMAENWLKSVDVATPQNTALDAGEILAFAFPDRIALKRAGKQGEYLMANGKGAYIDGKERLARENCLVIAEAQGSEQRARIVLAAPFDEKRLEQHFAQQIESKDIQVFDEREKRVKARRVTKLGALVLKEQPLAAAGGEAAQVLIEALKTHGLDALNLVESSKQFLARVNFLHRHAADEWPQLSLPHLNVAIDDWLAPYIPGATSFAEITPQVLNAALEGLLNSRQRRALDKEAPAFFIGPLGEELRIDYEREGGPTVSLRVQKLFGLKTHPMLANGKIPLAFELLSPAARPIQLTRDVPAFWRGSWAEVRRDLRGRYPKHEWPEDPIAARPTARAKPRK